MPLQNFWAYVFHRSCSWLINIITNVFATVDNFSSVVMSPAAAWEPTWKTPASPRIVASVNLETHDGFVAFHFGLGIYLQGAEVHSLAAQFRIFQTTPRLTSHPIWRCFAWVKKIRPGSVTDQRRTYPFPNPVTVNWQRVKVNLGLGRGRYAVARILTLINKYLFDKDAMICQVDPSPSMQNNVFNLQLTVESN